jgi:ectoine hydroxylase-related dioxygenase (phytanoyl-CoA dioxygenase family)
VKLNVPNLESGEDHQIERFTVDQTLEAIEYFKIHGYVVFQNAFSVDLGAVFWEDVERQIATNKRLTFNYYGKEYQGDSRPEGSERLPRIVDIESHSRVACDLLFAPSILRFLGALYGQAPTCLQTLTYKYSSEQGAHSDRSLVAPACAGDYDRETLVASWLALEASDESNGALVIWPGSHKVRKRGFFDGFENDYGKYTNWLMQWLVENGFKEKAFRAHPGDILFWHGDLVHAGGPILSEAIPPPTRRSLVCHYAAIDETQGSWDQRWVRSKLSGGTYYKKVWTDMGEQRDISASGRHGDAEKLALPPVSLRKTVGPIEDGFYENPGGVPIFGDAVPEEKFEAVFDFGCGCGRNARQMMLMKRRPNRYLGIDLNREAINWCTANLGVHDQAFEFQHFDVFNAQLNPQEWKAERSYTLAFPTSRRYTLVNAHSVFTHITEPSIGFYLGEVARVLDLGGVFRSTWFLFDKRGFPMMQEFQNCLYINLEDATNATIFDYRFLENLFSKVGLVIHRITPPVIRGFQWELIASHLAAGQSPAEFPEDVAPIGICRPPV